MKRGENSGRKLQHDFIALSLETIPLSPQPERWIAHATVKMPDGPDKPAALAAWVSTSDKGVVQATGGWLNPPAL